MSKTKLTNKVRKYLESLTKEELIDLIMKVAPLTFHENIKSQFATQKGTLAMFHNASDTISSILFDDELLYEPSAFERALLDQLEKLRGLWEKLPSQIGELMIRIVQDVEEAFENGYLYIEKHGEKDEYFESEEVNEYMLQFIKSLPNNTQSKYMEEFKEVLSNSGYSTFLSVERKLLKM
jgi:hypothetical protein